MYFLRDLSGDHILPYTLCETRRYQSKKKAYIMKFSEISSYKRIDECFNICYNAVNSIFITNNSTQNKTKQTQTKLITTQLEL